MMSDKIPEKSGKHLLLLIFLALISFIPLFIFQGIGKFDFWWWMSCILVFLMSISFYLDRPYLSLLKRDYFEILVQKFWRGVFSAAILYGVFYLGNYLSREWFGFAEKGIENVYKFKGDASAIRIAILMLVIIGPGEELFWRGYLQRNLSLKFGKWTGFALALILYTGVHVATGNIMLIVAALVCGAFWGWMYMRYQSVMMNVFSHTVWDLAVFILLPFS